MAARITLASLAAQVEALATAVAASNSAPLRGAPRKAKAANGFVAARRARAIAGLKDGSLVKCANNPKHVMSALRTSTICKRCTHA